MALIRELYAPQLAFLPIGGHFTMGPREAALAVELLGVEDVVPIHYGTFPILTGTPEQLRAELDARGLGDGPGPRARAGRDRQLGTMPGPSRRSVIASAAPERYRDPGRPLGASPRLAGGCPRRERLDGTLRVETDQDHPSAGGRLELDPFGRRAED